MNSKTSNIYPWVIVGLLWGVALLNYMDRQMLSTMRIPMMVDVRELESAANFGRLMAVFLWVYGLMSPISGIIGDRMSRKWLIVGSLCVWSGVTYLMGYATTFDQLYWLRGIMGISEALYLPAALSLIADFHQDKTRSLAVGIHMTGLYVGQAIGGFGATFAAMYSWHSTFHWFGIIGVGYGVILAFFLRDKERGTISVMQEKVTKIPVLKSLAMLFSNVFFWIILFYFCVPGTPGWAAKNWLPTLFSESLSIDISRTDVYYFHRFVVTVRSVSRWIYIRPLGAQKCTRKGIYGSFGVGFYHSLFIVYRIRTFHFRISVGNNFVRSGIRNVRRK